MTIAERIDDLSRFEKSLGEFLSALQKVDATKGPQAGPHSFFRGGNLRTYDQETREALDQLRGLVDIERALDVWDSALLSEWNQLPVWLHGDIAATNLLVTNGKLSAVIDFGCSAIGGPACDLTIAWTFFSEASREVFREAVSLDRETWARARGWALWKALITLVEYQSTDELKANDANRVIADVLADHER
ncbi:MAG: aminoglycoside phosphotransferase (APT) family kinase protein [Planctomycetota bacterium]